MEIAATEIAASLVAFALLSLVVIGGGAAIAGGLRFPGFAGAPRLERAGLSLICGLGCLPVLLDFAGRLGPLAMSGAALTLMAPGLWLLARPPSGVSSLSWGWIAGAGLWILLALTLIVDMPGVGRLQHSVLIVDHVKHASTTWALAEAGAPPWNPALYEPGRAMSYYYLFYTLTAVATVLGAPLGIAARHAAFASTALIAFALVALADAVLKRSGVEEALGRAKAARTLNSWIPALLLATGLDILPLSILFSFSSLDNVFLRFSIWDVQVTSWFNSAMWVPHHLAALCAAFVGFMALTAQDGGWRRIALAGLAFASMAGESIYVAMVAALGTFFWLLSLLRRRRFVDVAHLAAASALSLALAAPWLLTLAPRLGGGGPAPIGFRLRGPQWIDLVAGSVEAGAPYRALSMPAFYLIDFGVFALGSFAFWRAAGRRGYANELGRLLICLTAASFLIGSFFNSTILFNDLGWRAMLFAQFATLIWTAAAARQGGLFDGPLAVIAKAGLALGYAGTLAAAAQMRVFIFPPFTGAEIPDERAAWRWLDGRLPHGAVVQARPEKDRAVGYALYGHFPAALADGYNSLLYGATRPEIDARMAVLGPIFSDPGLGVDEARRRAARYGVAALVVSSRDPVFAAPGAWTASAKADYANPNFRIYLMERSAP